MDGDNTLKLCCFEGVILAMTTGAPLSIEQEGLECGNEACVTDNTMDLVSLTLSHNLLNDACPCEEVSPDCCDCVSDDFKVCEGKQPIWAMISVAGSATDGSCDSCDAVTESFLSKLLCAPPVTCDVDILCQPQWEGGAVTACVTGTEDPVLEIGVSAKLFRSGTHVHASGTLIFGSEGEPPPCLGTTVNFGPIDLGEYPVDCKALGFSMDETSRAEGSPKCCNLPSPLRMSFHQL